MDKHNQVPLQDLDESVALRAILEGTATETGERFFAALVENRAKAMKVLRTRLSPAALKEWGTFISGRVRPMKIHTPCSSPVAMWTPTLTLITTIS